MRWRRASNATTRARRRSRTRTRNCAKSSAWRSRARSSLKRAVETLPDGRSAAAGPSRPRSDVPPAASPSTTAPDTNAFKYLAFEDRFRGSSDEIRTRLLDYLPLFAGASNVLDVGCGRGELLELLRERQIDARGIDVNDAMVEACRERGLVGRASRRAGIPVRAAGCLARRSHCDSGRGTPGAGVPDAAHRGGVPQAAPGAPLVLETINAACWAAFFESYIRDFTHVRPLHPETLRYLVQAGGFATAEIQFRAPIAEHDKLPLVKVSAPARAGPPPPPTPRFAIWPRPSMSTPSD